MKTLYERKIPLVFCILFLVGGSSVFAQTKKEEVESKIDSKLKIKMEGLEESLRGLENLVETRELPALENLEINLEGLELEIPEIELHGLEESLQGLEEGLMGLEEGLEGLEALEGFDAFEGFAGFEAFEVIEPFEHFRRDDGLTGDEQLKLESLRSLLKMDEKKAFPAIKSALEKEKNPKIRKRLVGYLVRMDNAETISILGNLAKNDPDRDVRKRAIYYLGKSGDKRAVKILQEILQR